MSIVNEISINPSFPNSSAADPFTQVSVMVKFPPTFARFRKLNPPDIRTRYSLCKIF